MEFVFIFCRRMLKTLCLDLQVLVVAKSWPQKGDFLEEVKRLAVETDTPVCYYPGVGKAYVSMKERYAKAGKLLLDGKTGNDVTMVDCGVHGTEGFDNHATKHEAFCPILAWVEVDGGLRRQKFAGYYGGDFAKFDRPEGARWLW